MLTKSSPSERIDNSVKEQRRSTIRLLAIIEATTVNAVAKNMLEFHRAARELNRSDPDSLSIETSLVTFVRENDRTTESDNELVTVTRDLGIEVDVITESGRFDLRVIPALREIVHRRAPDIIVTHQVKSHFLMKLSRLWRQYPWVAFHHGYTTTDRKMRAYNRFNRWSLPTADKVITVCEAFASELSVAGVKRERIHVQHNSIRPEQAVSVAEVANLKIRLGIDSDESIVLSVGRLSREKAHIDLLGAFKHLLECNPAIKASLVIVGDGVERDRLETAAEAMGIRRHVVFTGEQSNVQPYYAAASLLVLPSHSEGSPYVLLEAMAAKVPIVATRVGGVPEIVEDEESALLVPVRDPRAMAEAVARILAKDELATMLTANAFTLAVTRHCPDTQTQSLIDLYDSVLTYANRTQPAGQ